MADIDIQRKERGPWPWIIGALVLILVIWGIAELVRTDDPDPVAVDATVLPAEPVMPPPVEEPAEPTPGARFNAWVRDSAEAADAMGQEHEYTRQGIRRMAAALENLMARDTAPQVQQQVQRMRQQAQAIEQSDTRSLEHASQARQAFLAAVQVLDELRERPHLRQAGLEERVGSARQAAEQVRADMPLLEQRGQVHAFFERVGDAIRRAEEHYVI